MRKDIWLSLTLAWPNRKPPTIGSLVCGQGSILSALPCSQTHQLSIQSLSLDQSIPSSELSLITLASRSPSQAFVRHHNATDAGTETAAAESPLQLRHQLVLSHGLGQPDQHSGCIGRTADVRHGLQDDSGPKGRQSRDGGHVENLHLVRLQVGQLRGIRVGVPQHTGDGRSNWVSYSLNNSIYERTYKWVTCRNRT